MFLTFLGLDKNRGGTLKIGELTIQIKKNERIEDVIDNILNGKDEKAKIFLYTHITRVIQGKEPDSDIGKRVIKIAEDHEKPFRWGFYDVELRYDSSIKPYSYGVCQASPFRDKLIQVNVYNPITHEAIDGDMLFAGENFPCFDNETIVKTSNKKLVEEAMKIGNVAKAQKRVMIP